MVLERRFKIPEKWHGDLKLVSTLFGAPPPRSFDFMMGIIRGSTHDASSLITDKILDVLSPKASFGRSNALRNLHLDQTREAGHWSWKCLERGACQRHAGMRLGSNMSSFPNTEISKGGREPFWRCSGKRLIHDSPCSRQTGKPLRNSYTSQKNGPQTKQPTNKLTSFDLSISFTKWPSIRAAATDLKIPQKWHGELKLVSKAFIGAPQPRTSKDFKKRVFWFQ